MCIYLLYLLLLHILIHIHTLHVYTHVGTEELELEPPAKRQKSEEVPGNVYMYMYNYANCVTSVSELLYMYVCMYWQSL